MLPQDLKDYAAEEPTLFLTDRQWEALFIFIAGAVFGIAVAV